MERKNPRVTVELPRRLHKAFHHKLTDEDLTVKAVVRQLIELWVKGGITLPHKPVEPTQGKKPGKPE